jgi:hypothetical protein
VQTTRTMHPAAQRAVQHLLNELVTGPLGIADSLAFSVTGKLRDRQAALDDEPGSDGPSLLGGPTGFGYPGAGGNLGYAEPAHRFAIAVAKNRMGQGWPTAIDASVRRALGLPIGPGFNP